MTCNLRPQFVARLSGLPTQSIINLQSSFLLQGIERMIAVDNQEALSRDAFDHSMFHLIGQLPPGRLRNRALDIRRDLLTGRVPTPSRLSRLQGELGADLLRVIGDYQAHVSHVSGEREAFRTLFRTETHRARRELQQLVSDADFQMGILASSPSLFGRLARYRMASPAETSAKSEQVERGVLRYFSRASMKATPFSRFCAVVPGTFDSPFEERARIAGNATQKFESVILNKQLYAHLWAHLSSLAPVRRRLRVSLNSTLQVSGRSYRFLAAHGTREAFQLLRRTPALDLVIGFVTESPPISLDELVVRLSAGEETESNEEEATLFVERLLHHGLLSLRAIVSDQDRNWHKPLGAFLKSIPDDHARLVVELLYQADSALQRYATGGIGDRNSALLTLQAISAELWQSLGIESPPHSLGPFMEDCGASATYELPASAKLAESLEIVARVARAMSRIGAATVEHSAMRNYFDARYEQGTAVPVLEFYEHYYRDHLQHRHQSGANKASGAGEGIAIEAEQNDVHPVSPKDAAALTFPFDSPQIRTRRAAELLLRDAIRCAWKARLNALELNISLATLENCLEGVVAASPPWLSVAAFCQLAFEAESQDWRCVLNKPGFATGYGKFFSRFMHVLPDVVLANTREANRTISSHLLAEILGDSGHNANFHPPLVSRVLSHPGGLSDGSTAEVSIAELDVIADQNSPSELCLVQRSTGSRVIPLDLGFLNSAARSPLYRMLINLGPPAGSQVPLPESPDDESEIADGQGSWRSRVVYRPRILIGNVLVVARRRWSIPKALFPTPVGGENEADYFVRVHRWRADHGLPLQIFVSIWLHGPSGAPVNTPKANMSISRAQPRTPTDVDEATESSISPRQSLREGSENQQYSPAAAEGPSRAQVLKPRPSRDLHKPQFIDFSSPLFVGLFGKLLTGLVDAHVIVEECYPIPEQLASGEAGAPAAELVMQFDAHRSRS